MPTKIEKDHLTGKETTGHDWDGVRELNTPLPKWWLYTWLATIAWSLVVLVLYPAIPLGFTHTDGLLSQTTRGNLETEVGKVSAERAPLYEKIRKLDLQDIQNDSSLRAFALNAGKAAFADNCTPCHGAAGSGRIGYPNLADDVWLWGGSFKAIHQTIEFGIRSGHEKARESAMPRFGADQILQPAELDALAVYVASLYQLRPLDAGEKAAQLFADNCSVCHGDRGEGRQEYGAPPLLSATHLYGADQTVIRQQLNAPRHGVMPAWAGRLDEVTIKSLTLYVHSLGGGQ
jgi:cytochrome c oxidase cbb3-type subunit 3